LEEHELNQERLAVGAEDSESIPFTIRASNPQNRHMRHQKTDLLPPFQNIRSFSFVKQIYLDTFYCVYWKEYMGGRREVHLRPDELIERKGRRRRWTVVQLKGKF
jgi:hypothetical protein